MDFHKAVHERKALGIALTLAVVKGLLDRYSQESACRLPKPAVVLGPPSLQSDVSVASHEEALSGTTGDE